MITSTSEGLEYGNIAEYWQWILQRAWSLLWCASFRSDHWVSFFFGLHNRSKKCPWLTIYYLLTKDVLNATLYWDSACPMSEENIEAENISSCRKQFYCRSTSKGFAVNLISPTMRWDRPLLLFGYRVAVQTKLGRSFFISPPHLSNHTRFLMHQQHHPIPFISSLLPSPLHPASSIPIENLMGCGR